MKGQREVRREEGRGDDFEGWESDREEKELMKFVEDKGLNIFTVI